MPRPFSVIVITAGLMAAVPAQADPGQPMSDDEKFMALMLMDGMSSRDPLAAIADARRMCEYLVDNGLTQRDGVAMLQSQGWDFDKAASVTAKAVVVYCPEVGTG